MNRKERKELRRRMTWLKRQRRPLFYTWQWPIFAAIIALFWWQLPRAAHAKQENGRIPAAENALRYVTLDKKTSQLLQHNARTFWGTGRNSNASGEMEIALVELTTPPPDIEPLKSDRIPGKWTPEELPELPQETVEILGETPQEREVSAGLPPEPRGIRVNLSPELAKSGFNFTPPSSFKPKKPGKASFYIESAGIANVFLLTPRTAESGLLETELARKEIPDGCRGSIEISWR